MHISNAYIVDFWTDFGMIPIYTNHPFRGHTDCTNNTPIAVNTYRPMQKAFHKKLTLFGDKFENMHECDVNILIIQHEPFLFGLEHRNGKTTVGGIEGGILHELSRVINFTPNYTLSEQGHVSSIFQTVISSPISIHITYSSYIIIRAN